MAETEILKLFITALPEVGIGLVFLYLFLKERRYSSDATERLIELHKGSIETSKDVTHALNNNTHAIETLTERVNSLWGRER